ncbi:DNA polymerase I [Acidithiobacillus ferrivorans]|nr:DNA polymerase I [Acidithiobacillus ferrivorans]
MSHLLLVDGNNVGYAAMYVPALSALSHGGLFTGGIMGVAQSVMRLSQMFPAAVPVVLWDGRAHWRHALCPEYKANRKDTPEKIAVAERWNQQQPMARALLLHMGILQIRAADAEADDLAWRICQGLQDPEAGVDHVTLCSNDQDWLQALSPNIDWFSPITDRAITFDDFLNGDVKDGPFLNTDEYILAKAMAGDKSDNIDGVPGVGIKTAVKLLRAHGGLDGIGDAVSSARAKDKKSADIAAAGALIQRNRELMDWSLAKPSAPGQFGLVRESFQDEAVQETCALLGLDRLAKRLAPDSEFVTRSAQWPVSPVIDFVESCC